MKERKGAKYEHAQDADELAPSGTGKVDLLIRFFESQFFNAWIAVTYLFKNLGPGVHDYLCNKLYTLPEADVELYLSQLTHLCVSHPGDDTLERVLMDLCAHSLRIAVKTYWLLLAISQDNAGNMYVGELRDRCEQAALAGDWKLPFRMSRYSSLSQPEGSGVITNKSRISNSKQQQHSGSFQRPIISPKTAVGQARENHTDQDSDADCIAGAMSPEGLGTGVYPSLLLDTSVEALLLNPGQNDDMSKNNSSTDNANISTTTTNLDLQQQEQQLEISTAMTAQDQTVSAEAVHREDAEGTNSALDSVFAGRMSPILSPPNSPQRRHTTFGATMDLIEDLTAASSGITVLQGEERKEALQLALQRIDANIQRAAKLGIAPWFPLGPSVRQRVVRLACSESRLLNSKDKAPFTLFVEVLTEEEEEEGGEEEGNQLVGEHGVASDNRGYVSEEHPPTRTTYSNGHHHHHHYIQQQQGEGVSINNSSLVSHTKNDLDSIESLPLVQPPSAQQMVNALDNDPAAAAAAAEGIPWVAHHHRRSSSSGISLSGSTLMDGIQTQVSPPSTSPSTGLQQAFTMSERLVTAAVGVPNASISSTVETVPGEGEIIIEELSVMQVAEQLSKSLHLQGDLDMRIRKRAQKARHSRTSSQEALHLVAKKHKLPLPDPLAPLPIQPSTAALLNPSSPPVTGRLAELTGIALGAGSFVGRERKQDLILKQQPQGQQEEQQKEEGMQQLNLDDRNHSIDPSQLNEAEEVYGEKWLARKARIREESPYGQRPGWELCCVIVKTGDDCRQELLAMQLIRTFHSIFQEAKLPLWLRPYEVLVTSNRTAIIEMVPNAPSIHSIKAAQQDPYLSLRQHLADKFIEGTPAFSRARRNFAESLAAYSLVCYFLQIKDRHNGNILLDDAGHLIHIDFGYMLSNSPGNVNFESAPFKLTRELLEVLDSGSDGKSSELFNYFKVLFLQGFLVLRKHSERITLLVEMMSSSGMPCFQNKSAAVNALKKRFCLNMPEKKVVEVVIGLIGDSLDAWSTRQYDYYQRLLNGIL